MVAEKHRKSASVSSYPPSSASTSTLSHSETPASHKSYATTVARESIHLIPTPEKRPPRYSPYSLEVWSLLLTILITLGLAIGLQVGLFFSRRNQGFAVREDNVLSFATPSFLLSFFPTLLIIPLVYQIREMDFELRYYHPYVILSRGRATVSESLLLDYTIGLGWTIWFSIKHRHTVIFFSTLTALAAFLFQPLAGSIFELNLVRSVAPWTATGTRAVGLLSDVESLNAFVASAGYAEAAVYHRLPDPPFVMRGWATAEFTVPASASTNGLLIVNTTGVQTQHNCANPAVPPIVEQNGANFTILTKSVKDGCEASVTFNPAIADEQYGVQSVECLNGEEEINFQGVMFWFFHRRLDDGQPEARTVFCAPTISVFNVQATVNLTNFNLTKVEKLSDYTAPNNVTGAPVNGRAYNAVRFWPAGQSHNNTFVEARAVATASGLSGAIFRLAQSVGLQRVFDDPTGFLTQTGEVYRQHLSVTAKSIYFVPANNSLPAEFSSLKQRLFIDPLAGNALSAVLFVVGITATFVHIIHRRMRKNLYLTTPPGTMAGILALTSRSGFGELLLPYDDRATLKKKLGGFRFGLDRRTGAIVADTYGSYGTREDAMRSLLANEGREDR